MLKRTFLKNGLTVSALFMLLLSPFAKSESIAVIVNPKSSLVQADVPLKTLQDIFLGKVTEIKGQALQPVNQEQQRPITILFNEAVLKKNENQVRAYWSKMVFSGTTSPPPSLADDQSVKIHVAKNSDAISYVQKSQVDETVKVLMEVNP